MDNVGACQAEGVRLLSECMLGGIFAGNTSRCDRNRNTVAELIGRFAADVKALNGLARGSQRPGFGVARHAAKGYLIGGTRLLSIEGSLVDGRENRVLAAEGLVGLRGVDLRPVF